MASTAVRMVICFHHIFKVMSAAHCKENGDWKAGAGSATLNNQRQTRNGKKQLVHPQYKANTERVTVLSLKFNFGPFRVWTPDRGFSYNSS